MFGYYGSATYAVGRLHALNASAVLCLARILLALVEGLGPELSRKRDVRLHVPVFLQFRAPPLRYLVLPSHQLLSLLLGLLLLLLLLFQLLLLFCLLATSG